MPRRLLPPAIADAAQSLRLLRSSIRNRERLAGSNVQVSVNINNLQFPPPPIQPILPPLVLPIPPSVPPRPKEKRKYTTHSDEERQIIINMAFDNGYSARKIVENMGGRVKKKYVQSLIRTFKKEQRINKKPKRTNVPKVYTDEEIEYIAQLQLEHNEWTYKQVREEWRIKYGTSKQLSNHVIHDALQKYNFTTKRLDIEPPQRNTEAAILVRRAYCNEAITWEDNSVVYIDEKGFNLHYHRGRGRMVKGLKAMVPCSSNRGVYVSILGAISPIYGLMAYEVKVGYFCREDYVDFLSNLFRHHAFQRTSMRLIMDNCSIHHGQDIKDVVDGQPVRHIITYMPPYSPHLNAIEYCWSQWAWWVNTHEHNSQEALRTLIEYCALNTKIVDCAGWHREVWRYHFMCVQNIPLRYAPPRAQIVERPLVVVNDEQPQSQSQIPMQI
jgi:transposase